MMENRIRKYREEVLKELQNILQYWIRNTPDYDSGGFYGQITDDNRFIPEAPKGSVLNARILWTFSSSFINSQDSTYLDMAQRAYDYMINHMLDTEHEGVFWSVDFKGKPLDTRKQLYAQAFALFGFSEFYRATGNRQSLDYARRLFELIETKGKEVVYGGYIEGFGREWNELSDFRLSDKDANEKKTTNTHLHILEAYTNLYRYLPDKRIKKSIIELIDLFLQKIINIETGHLQLFFDEEWNVKDELISFGHDIEASWLIMDAAFAVDYDALPEVANAMIKLADAASRGLDADGGLWYEYDSFSGVIVREKHWWPQAEAAIGYLNCWKISGDETYLNHSLQVWDYIKGNIIDSKQGEWFWGRDAEGNIMQGYDKAGFWKCPYHNVRACLEIAKRIG